MQGVNRTWVVVADGGQAKVMVYYRKSGDLEVLPEALFSQPNLSTSELVSDAHGRRTVGTGRGQNQAPHADTEPRTDPHDYAEFRFIAHVTDYLEQHIADFDQLIVIAAPKALGVMRKKMSKKLQQKVITELAKDLTHMPLDELRQPIQEALR